MWTFRLRSLFLVLACIAFILGWLRSFGTMGHGLAIFSPSGYGFCSVGILLIVWFQLRNANGCPCAWNLIALGWFVSLADIVEGLFETVSIVSCDDRDALVQMIQEGILWSLVSSITWPLFLTIPALYVLVLRYRSRPGFVSCWIYGALLVALVDTILSVALVSFTVGAWSCPARL